MAEQSYAVGDRVEVTLQEGGYWKGIRKGVVTKVNAATRKVSVRAVYPGANSVRAFSMDSGVIRPLPAHPTDAADADGRG